MGEQPQEEQNENQPMDIPQEDTTESDNLHEDITEGDNREENIIEKTQITYKF